MIRGKKPERDFMPPYKILYKKSYFRKDWLVEKVKPNSVLQVT